MESLSLLRQSAKRSAERHENGVHVPPEREGLREPRAPSRSCSHLILFAASPVLQDVLRAFASVGSLLRRDSFQTLMEQDSRYTYC